MLLIPTLIPALKANIIFYLRIFLTTINIATAAEVTEYSTVLARRHIW